MKISYPWLREWVDIPWPARELGARLTMAGFEMEALDTGTAEDPLLELNVTPNRGDAMSVLGIAREVGALSGRPVIGPAMAPVPARSDDTLGVLIGAPAACPRFAGRVIRRLDNRAKSPEWLARRLERAGIRSITPLVDATNYVMLELGQPMHAYDLQKIEGRIKVDTARPGETLVLLDGRLITPAEDVLLIKDERGPIGMAGIMGGERTAVSEATTEVFLEAAHFTPDAVAGRARRHGLQTDASQRFERGVDPALPQRAMERATALILEILGGEPGPLELTEMPGHLPRRAAIELRRLRLQRLLGLEIEPKRVTGILRALEMDVKETDAGWRATAPSHRFDIAIEPDLIEEVARLVGYDAIAEVPASLPHRVPELSCGQPLEREVLETLAARGYQEAITYAFVDPAWQERLFPERTGIMLANPIASDLAAMRVSLWPGLLRAALENQRRQQERIKLFEHAVRFGHEEIDTLAAVACGRRWPEQWGLAKEALDFYDMKSDLLALIEGTGAAREFSFVPARLGCLHPGRAARVMRAGAEVGWIGELHPALIEELGFSLTPVLFELDYGALAVVKPAYREISRFPQVRRDLALVVDEGVTFGALRERVTLASPGLLTDCFAFDVYRGPGIESGRKSVALGLIFQDISRTLTEQEVDGAMASIVAELRTSLKAKIRE